MDGASITSIILLLVVIILAGYLAVYTLTEGITKECISQNATWNNLTKSFDGCKINALAEVLV